MPGPRKEGEPEHFEIPASPPEILAVGNFDQLQEAIRGVTLLKHLPGIYPYLNSGLTLQETPVNSVFPTALYTLNENLKIQKLLRTYFLNQGIDILHFTPDTAFIRFLWGEKEQTIVPPFVEISDDDGGLQLITDGLHRYSLGREIGQDTVATVLIEGSAVPLSSLPVGWEEVKALDKVPLTKSKRRLRFQDPKEMFLWFGLNAERVASGIPDSQNFIYTALFRNLDFSQLGKEANKEDFLVKIGMPLQFLRDERLLSPTSVGVIVHTGSFDLDERRKYHLGEPSILVVEQLDQKTEDVHPWGIPAGRREGKESVTEIALREVAEETGINLDPNRLKWFCPVDERKVVLSYSINRSEIPGLDGAEKFELGIEVIPPRPSMGGEIGRLALVPVKVFADHMLVGPHRIYRSQAELKSDPYWKSQEQLLGGNVFVPAMYRPKIWQAIRHQMFVRRIIPDYLG